MGAEAENVGLEGSLKGHPVHLVALNRAWAASSVLRCCLPLLDIALLVSPVLGPGCPARENAFFLMSTLKKALP